MCSLNFWTVHKTHGFKHFWEHRVTEHISATLYAAYISLINFYMTQDHKE